MLSVFGCNRDAKPLIALTMYPMDSLEKLVDQNKGVFDRGVSADGKGSLRFEIKQPTTIRLFETGDIDVENSRLMYSAKLRTRNVKGQVYLEMWCYFKGKGEFFSRALHSPLSGTKDWTIQETSFFLRKGENPDNIKLNVKMEGTGTVWVDDVRLSKGAS